MTSRRPSPSRSVGKDPREPEITPPRTENMAPLRRGAGGWRKMGESRARGRSRSGAPPSSDPGSGGAVGASPHRTNPDPIPAPTGRASPDLGAPCVPTAALRRAEDNTAGGPESRRGPRTWRRPAFGSSRRSRPYQARSWRRPESSEAASVKRRTETADSSPLVSEPSTAHTAARSPDARKPPERLVPRASSSGS